jgi:hypothetical protein
MARTASVFAGYAGGRLFGRLPPNGPSKQGASPRSRGFAGRSASVRLRIVIFIVEAVQTDTRGACECMLVVATSAVSAAAARRGRAGASAGAPFCVQPPSSLRPHEDAPVRPAPCLTRRRSSHSSTRCFPCSIACIGKGGGRALGAGDAPAGGPPLRPAPCGPPARGAFTDRIEPHEPPPLLSAATP